MLEFAGCYRGIVKVNDDSSTDHPHLGRIKVYVPQVYGQEITDEQLPWAEPCFPLGGGRTAKIGYGIIAIPPVNASVWVMFEQGDSTHPVWIGCWYGERDIGDGVAQEMPDEAVVDYPRAMLFYLDGMFIRVTPDSKIELASASGDTHVSLYQTGKIEIKTAVGDVEVEATTGKVKLTSGQDLSLVGGEDTLQTIEMDPARTPPRVQIVAKSFQVLADEIELRASGQTILRADSLRAIARAASGFEKHDNLQSQASVGDY